MEFPRGAKVEYELTHLHSQEGKQQKTMYCPGEVLDPCEGKSQCLVKLTNPKTKQTAAIKVYKRKLRLAQ